MLVIHCDIVHPESGEVLAEPGNNEINVQSPRGQQVLAVCKVYPEFYRCYLNDDGNTVIELNP